MKSYKNINMQNSIGLDKNVLILTIVLFGLIVALSIMFTLSKNPVYAPTPVLKGDVAALNSNIAELNNFDTDLALSAQDEIISQELDSTLNEVGEIDSSSASLINDEGNISSLDNDLNSLTNDQKINEEIDRSLQEVSL